VFVGVIKAPSGVTRDSVVVFDFIKLSFVVAVSVFMAAEVFSSGASVFAGFKVSVFLFFASLIILGSR
jgi:hypothetical protein